MKKIAHYGDWDYIYTIISYLFETANIQDEQQFREAIITNLNFSEEKIMTLAEQYMQKGIEKGIEKGSASGEKGREKSREKILDIIRENTRITMNELAEKTGLSIKGIEKNMRLLKKEKVLRRIGPDKGGHWEVQ